jgi:predicted CxxxxCH...CXXCH cytochrome family protein
MKKYSLLFLRLFMMMVVFFGAFAQSSIAKTSPLAGKKDPIWGVSIGNLPPWLKMYATSSDLDSKYELVDLAGRLIKARVVDANDCPQGGLTSGGSANECGVKRALPAVYNWQNQFNASILETSVQTNIPPRLLKNIFTWESQFWPQSAYVNAHEYGLGRITEADADVALRWNAAFYKQTCKSVYNAKICKKNYASSPDDVRTALRSKVVQLVNADCADCSYGVDLGLSDRSVPVFAQVLFSNAMLVKNALKTNLAKDGALAYADLWKFTLLSYESGQACFLNALSRTVKADLTVNWGNLSAQLDPGCTGSNSFIKFVSNTDNYSSWNTPTATPTVTFAPTQTLTSTSVPTATATATQTSTPTFVPTATATASQTSTPTSVPTATAAVTQTSTPTSVPTSTATATLVPTNTSTPVPTATLVTTDESIMEASKLLDAGEHVSDELLVKLKNPNDKALFSAVNGTAMRVVGEGLTLIKVPAGQLKQSLALLLANGAVEYAEPNYVRHMEETVPNDFYYYGPSWRAQQLTYLRSMQVTDAWDKTRGNDSQPIRGQGVIVAVIDTGVNYTHPEFGFDSTYNASLTPHHTPYLVGGTGAANNTNASIWLNYRDGSDNCWGSWVGESDYYEWDCYGSYFYQSNDGLDSDGNGKVDDTIGWNFVANNNNVLDDSANSHGTSVAGLIASQMNTTGIAGVASGSKIMVLKALDNTGSGTAGNIAAAVNYAVSKGAKVINLSFGGAGSSTTEQTAICAALDAGVTVVASAGNTGDATVHYPAGYTCPSGSNIIGVGSLDTDTVTRASFSSYGTQVDLMAPGVNVWAPDTTGGYALQSGTSASAAYVSGVAALLASYNYNETITIYYPDDPTCWDERDNWGWPPECPYTYSYPSTVWPYNTPAKIFTALTSTAADLGTAGREDEYGYGRVQALAAVNSALSADLSLAQTVDVATPLTGDKVVFTLTVTNNSPSGVTSIKVKDVLPAGLTYFSHSAPAGTTYTNTSGTGEWNVGALAGNSNKVLTITATVDVVGTLANVAEISASGVSDPDSTPNNGVTTEDDYASVTVTSSPKIVDLSLSAQQYWGNNLNVNLGDTVSLIFLMSNEQRGKWGAYVPGSDASGVEAQITLPAGLTYQSHEIYWSVFEPQQSTYNPVTGIWKLNAGAVIPYPADPNSGQYVSNTYQLRINALVTGGGSLPVYAEITHADQLDPNSTPNNHSTSENDDGAVTFTVKDPAMTEAFWAQAQTCAGSIFNSPQNSITLPYGFDGAVSQCGGTMASGSGLEITNLRRNDGSDTTSFTSIASAALSIHPRTTGYIECNGWTYPCGSGSSTPYTVQISTDNATWQTLQVFGSLPNLSNLSYDVTSQVNTPEKVNDFRVRIIKGDPGTSDLETPVSIYVDQAALTVIGNSLPSLFITAPADGVSYKQGIQVAFASTATDPDEIPTAGTLQNVRWTSDMDGLLGFGRTLKISSLTPGSHLITGTITDSLGATASDSITVNIVPNAPPTVNITAPTTYTFAKGTSITFSGTATDNEDGSLSDSIVWSSDLEGPLGKGASLPYSALIPGAHTITAQVLDTDGVTSTATVSVTVNPVASLHSDANKCSLCHPRNSWGGTDPLNSPNMAYTSNAFCLKCHSSGSGASAITTHSNLDTNNSQYFKNESNFEILCVQCHTPHDGKTDNLFLVRPDVRIGNNSTSFLNMLQVSSPVVFTALKGANSMDDNNGDDLCLTCHADTNNPGNPMFKHSGGVGHGGVTVNNYSGKSCIACHRHDADGNPATKDGFTVTRVVNGSGTEVLLRGACNDCHDAPPATGAHSKHSDPTTVPVAYGETGVGSSATNYDFACGECHPTDITQHMNGTVDINVAQETAPVDSIKAKNGKVADGKVAVYSGGSCSNVYCHSGKSITSTDPGFSFGTDSRGNPKYNYNAYTVTITRSYKTSPVWTSPAGWTGYDECTGCHVFPPTTYNPEIVEKFGSAILSDPALEGATVAIAGAGDSHRSIQLDRMGYLGGTNQVVDTLHSANMRSNIDVGAVACRACHYGEIVADTGSYLRNVSGPYQLSVRMYNPVPVENHTFHVNGKADVMFDTVNTYPYDGWTFSLTGANYDPVEKTCSNTACHYSVGPNPNAGWGYDGFKQYSPVWGDPYYGAFGGQGDACGYCHNW